MSAALQSCAARTKKLVAEHPGIAKAFEYDPGGLKRRAMQVLMNLDGKQLIEQLDEWYTLQKRQKRDNEVLQKKKVRLSFLVSVSFGTD